MDNRPAVSDEQPLISVVTPCLNPGPRLFRCRRSIEAQTYPRVEHVVVDGGSTDGTVDFLQDNPDVVWVSERDSGQSEAINKGFRMSRGSLIGWLNADDILLPDAISLIVRAFLDAPSSSWVMGDVIVSEGRLGRREKPSIRRGPSGWATRNLAAQPGSFHPRWALEGVDYLDESLHFMMDMDLWIRMLDMGWSWTYVPADLAIFEIHDDSKSGGISHAEFLAEEAWVRLKSGRSEQAAFALGRAAAWSAFGTDEGPEMAIARIRGSRPGLSPLPPALVLLGYRVETTILQVKQGGLSQALNAVAPELWKNGLARARLRDVAAREVRRRLNRDTVDISNLGLGSESA